MPRQPRIDAPGLICHIMARGIEKRPIFSDESYLRLLVRYINLNPVRAGQKSSLSELESFPYAAHGYITGRLKADWFDRDLCLDLFGNLQKQQPPRTDPRLEVYQEYMLAGFQSFRQENKVCITLGMGQMIMHQPAKPVSDSRINEIYAAISEKYLVSQSEILSGEKTRSLVSARAELAFILEDQLGLHRREIGRRLRVSHTAVTKMIARSEADNRPQ